LENSTSIYEFERAGKTYRINLEGDLYGVEFWKDFSNWRYEPDTQALIESFCDGKTIFIDIGAAYGCMSLLACSLGAHVFSFEPNPIVYEGLKINSSLNESLGHPIKTFNKAISIDSHIIDVSEGSSESKQVLTPIVFTNWTKADKIEVISLKEFISNTPINVSEGLNLVLKVDIEGAEWKLFKDNSTLGLLKEKAALVIIALHPGLHRPLRDTSSPLGRLQFYWWNLRNMRDSWVFFKRIYPFCSILRTNLNQVKRPSIFTLLVLAGNHEFVLNFRNGTGI
jgi:FkbM family methyltransferase